MMKKLCLVLLAAALAAPAAAGDLNSWIELARKDLATAKQAILTEVMDFSATEADAFWPIYREYQTEAAAWGDRRLALLKGYADSFDTMNDVSADKLVNDSIKLQEDRIALMKKYYKKFNKAVGPTKAARAIQVENQLNTLIDLQIMSETPLIEAGEMTVK